MDEPEDVREDLQDNETSLGIIEADENDDVGLISRTTTLSDPLIATRPSTPLNLTVEDKFKRKLNAGDLLMQQLTKPVSEEVNIIENLCDSKHLLERNTKSFKCLAQLLLSSSSLVNNKLFLFPPLEDPGIELAFNFEEPPLVSDEIGIEKYKKMCQDMDIVPISRIIKSLETDTLDLKYYGLSNKQIKALSEAMKTNTLVKTLILQDNWLSVEMCQMVSDMLVESTSLQTVSLRECRIGEEGAQKLGEALSSIQTIQELDLSYNDLGDPGLLALKEALSENTSLKKLNLSHNNITEDSGEVMEKILIENKTIEELDLSWSGFFTALGNRRLFNGLTQSDHIKVLNLAWNGIGIVPAVRPLTKYLKKSQTLEVLDISNNRLVGQSLRITRTAINKNHSLQTLKIGNNIYSPDEAHFLLTMLAGKGKDPLHHVDMSNMWLNKESKPFLKKITNIGKSVKFGGILSDYVIHEPDAKKLIYDRCRYILNKPKKAKAKKDLGHLILTLPDHPITPEEFKKELKKRKIKKLDKDLLEAFMNLFMTKKRQIDCQALMQDYMIYYPDSQPPPPKPKKGKKGKKSKKKKETEEKEIQVHNLEAEPIQTDSGVPQTSEDGVIKDTQDEVLKDNTENPQTLQEQIIDAPQEVTVTTTENDIEKIEEVQAENT